MEFAWRIVIDVESYNFGTDSGLGSVPFFTGEILFRYFQTFLLSSLLACFGCDQSAPQLPVNEPAPDTVWEDVKPLPAGSVEPEDLDPWDENLELAFESVKDSEQE